MLDAARHDDHFTRLNPDTLFNPGFAVFHPEPAFHNHEKLVFVFVMMPGERALKLHELHVLAVQLRGDARIPVIVNQRKLILQIDLVHTSR